MAEHPNRKVASNVIALGAAAVIAVYTTGYFRTKPAADRLAQRAERRPVAATSEHGSPPTAAIPQAAPSPAARVTPTATVAPPTRVSQPRVSKVPVVSAPSEPAPAQTTTIAPATPSPTATIETAPPEASAGAPTADPLVPATSEPKPELPVVAAAPQPQYKDGTYLGWGYSRHGDIQAAVVIEAGRIASATIAQCRTRYPCSVIDALPPQVAVRQSPEIDYVTGATQSTDAFYYAVVEALSKAR